jgi:hypothetical protein
VPAPSNRPSVASRWTPSWRRAVPATAAALLAAASGCAFTRQPIPGFTVAEGKTPTQTVDRMQAQFAVIRRKLEDAVEPGMRRRAVLDLLDRYMGMAVETAQTHTGLDPYDFDHRRKPLFIYPRITCPLIAQCSAGGKAESAGGTVEEPAWLLPVILNRDVFREKSRPSWVLGSLLSPIIPDPRSQLPDDPRELAAAVRKDFHFMLLPRRLKSYDEVSLDDGPAGPVDLPSFEVQVPLIGRGEGKETVFRFPDSGKKNMDFVFRVPRSMIAERWSREAREGEVGYELFDLRMFPRIPTGLPDRPGPWGEFLRNLGAGKWLFAHRSLAEWSTAAALAGAAGERLPIPAEDCGAIADAIARFAVRYPYFSPELDRFAKPLLHLEKMASKEKARPEEIAAAVQDLEIAVGFLIRDDPCPAPVSIDEPTSGAKDFSFIVGADLQYDTDGSSLQQFLALIDPTRVPQSVDADLEPLGSIPDSLRRELLDAKFVIIVGDLGDGRGFSSTPNSLLLDTLGLTACRSPYSDGTPRPTRGEFPELRDQFRRCMKPIFAVPGNHDGFCTFGGILNQVAAVAGAGLETLPLLSLLGTPLKESIAPKLPTLVRLWRIAPPFYDGLVDWTLELGPHNVAFNYRGLAFVALNSFDLHQLERDQVGAIGNNWGGGVQEESAVWFDIALRYFGALDPGKRGLADRGSAGSFVFLHHDPRGSVAAKRGYLETEFGHYNDVTSPLNELTLGYLGLSWATYSGTYIPIVSPLFVGVIRSGSFGENFQERWMRRNAWDEGCYGGKDLVDAINRNLSGAPPIPNEALGSTYPPAGITHIFFGHDDTPVVAPWVHVNGRAVFPGQESGAGWEGFRNTFYGIYRRVQSKVAPSWAGRMRFYDGRQATVVRLDDLGDVFSKTNSHGFSLVTVRFPRAPAGGGSPAAGEEAPRPRVEVRWIPIPR